MSLTGWIRERINRRRKTRPALRRNEGVALYLRRLEDRRVLNVAAVADAYYMNAGDSSLSVSSQQSVLDNDTGAPLSANGGTFTTDQGGSVIIDNTGSFYYTSPNPPGSIYVDHFNYTATDGSQNSQGDVTIYVGEFQATANQSTLLPTIGVESETPMDYTQVHLQSSTSAALFLLNPAGVMFDQGTANGDSELYLRGMASDINHALESIQYNPPPGFSGFDDLLFEYASVTPPQQPPPQGVQLPPDYSGFVSIYVQPSEVITGPGSIFAQDDFYFVDPGLSNFTVSADAGVLSNDSTSGEGSLFVYSGPIQTDLGGTLFLYTDGGFSYTPPDLPDSDFIDSFQYTASDEIDTSNPANVLLFVGEVPVPEDGIVNLPLFTVEGYNPTDIVTVQLSSAQGSSLTLFDTTGVSFVSGTNGGSSIAVSGAVQDVNYALDSLTYAPPFNYSGDDSLTFQYIASGRSGNLVTQTAAISVEPIADPPALAVGPEPAFYQPGVPIPVNINVALTDTDGSEFLGFVVLDQVPAGVVPSSGQNSPEHPQTYFLLPGQLSNLTFLIDSSARIISRSAYSARRLSGPTSRACSADRAARCCRLPRLNPGLRSRCSLWISSACRRA